MPNKKEIELNAQAAAFVHAMYVAGNTSSAIAAAVNTVLAPIVEEEREDDVVVYARKMTVVTAQNVISDAMSNFWDDDEMEMLNDGLCMRFPKHAKAIQRIIDWAGDVSQQRDDEPSTRYERGFDKVNAAVARLPWKKR